MAAPKIVNLNSEVQKSFINVWGVLSGWAIPENMWIQDLYGDYYQIPEYIVFSDINEMEAWTLLKSIKSFLNCRKNMTSWYEMVYSGRKENSQRYIKFNRVAWEARRV